MVKVVEWGMRKEQKGFGQTKRSDLMESLLVRLGVILVGLLVFGCAGVWETGSDNFSFHFTTMKIIFFLAGVTSTMLSIVLYAATFDVEQKMPSFFFFTSSVATLLFWALLTGLVRL